MVPRRVGNVLLWSREQVEHLSDLCTERGRYLLPLWLERLTGFELIDAMRRSIDEASIIQQLPTLSLTQILEAMVDAGFVNVTVTAGVPSPASTRFE